MAFLKPRARDVSKPVIKRFLRKELKVVRVFVSALCRELEQYPNYLSQIGAFTEAEKIKEAAVTI
jgi:hypothetical protein